MLLGSKLTQPPGSQFYIELCEENFKRLLHLNHLWEKLNSTGTIPVWSPTKIVQMVLIGCISRSQGQRIGFQNAIFKNLLVSYYKAQSFHHLNVFYQLCLNNAPGFKIVSALGGHNFTSIYIQAVNWFLYSSITPIFWVRILYSENPPIFPIFSYILNKIPIF